MGTTYKELFKLYDLIQCGDTRSVKQFLSNNNLNVNLILPSKGVGVLHLAVGIEPLYKSKECTELLLKYGGDPNMSNDDGVTPVHIASIWGRLDNLKLLIGCGGDPALRDLDGYSGFDYAAREQQWPVYDYLHNVVDQTEDSWEPEWAYTFDLDKVLVSTDQMVAEYAPIADNELCKAATSRKSEMVRQWCEKTSLIMNKLYPTILTDTYTLGDEGSLWNSTRLPTDRTGDHGARSDESNETNASFKTCLSRKSGAREVEISGVYRLDLTSDRSKDSLGSTDLRKKKMSVYENFSLPGSPNTITHINYNSKSSLKKNKPGQEPCWLTSEFQKLTLDRDSFVTDDSHTDLDKALVVVQNKTNEWLSSYSECRVSDPAGNTRRSSASSGVSSSFSGGSIVVADVHEDYKYVDKEEDVVLIERRLHVSPVVLPVDETVDSNTPDQTILSVASSLPPTMEYDDHTLRAELLKLGFRAGPIQDTTRTLYLKKLHSLKKAPIVVKELGKTYTVELERSLRTDDWMRNLSPFMELESKVKSNFAKTDIKWREGNAKKSFTYLLLDSRLTGNLPARSRSQDQHASWVTFINSIFYIGKGKQSRPFSHLYQALTLWNRNFTTSQDKKVQHILNIWRDNVGVVCLFVFHNVIPAEAYTYEAAMIDVLGLQNLKNLKTGNYYGAAASWPDRDKKMLGLYLLYKAMMIYLTEGERQMRPGDID